MTDEYRRERAKLLLYSGLYIPADLIVVGASHDFDRDESYVLLIGDGLPEQPMGCSPVEFRSIEDLQTARRDRGR